MHHIRAFQITPLHKRRRIRCARAAWASRCAIVVVLATNVPTTLLAEAPADDSLALNVLLRDEYLAENVRDVCSRAATLPAEDRYRILTNRVLPNEDHSFRTDVDFTPTDPAPALSGRAVDSGFRVASGGEIVSPVIDVISTATSLGRLDELRQRVEAASPTSVEGQIDRLALLALVDIARDDLETARPNLSALLALVAPEGIAEPFSNDAVLLCVDAAARHPALSRTIVDATFRIVQSYQDVSERTVWQRQFSAACARIRQAVASAETETADAAVPFSRWAPASLPRARYRGAGCPPAEWITTPGHAENLFSHDQDLLYFAVPLRGNYEIECDAGTFGWRDSPLLVAGKSVCAAYDHDWYWVLEIDGSGSRIRLEPPLPKVREFIHYRTVVRDGAATTYFNGRAVHTQRLAPDHDPWLAVRSEARRDGGVRNLRITGDPVVPRELRLSATPDLNGWIPYFEETVGTDWQFHEEMGEMRAPRRPELRGSCAESALFYHRPMLEDGSIDYEFWYERGVCEAHAALDRLCFMLDPDGVKVHWLTDGRFDRTGLPPDNLIDEPGNRRNSGALSLNEGGWNRLRLTVRGDTVDVLLNGEPVYQRDIKSTNQRHFGLFHYADQTELRVRNVTWTGEWSREIPELDAQELVVDETGFLDKRLPELTAVFSHDFTNGLRLDQFSILEGSIPEHLTVAPDGLHATRPGAGGYRSATIAPSVILSGDFDITASFDQFVTEPRGTGASNLFLNTVAETTDECILIRRRTLFRGGDQQLIQCSRARREGVEVRRSFFAQQSMEAPAGTLRLARRGDTAYYLFAENDSPNFRLIGQDSFTAADLPLNGIQLKLQTHGDEGLSSVVWKNLTVRAEELSGPATTPIAQHTP